MLSGLVQKLLRMTVVFALLIALLPIGNGHAAADTLPVVITELQTGASDDAKAEFVEVYNPNASTVSVAGWQLQYFAESRALASGETRRLANLTGELGPHEFRVFAYSGYFQELAPLALPFANNVASGSLAQTGGAVRLADQMGVTVDVLGWGAAQVKEGQASLAPPAGKSLQRCLNPAAMALDTNDNNLDFAVYTATTPGAGVACVVPEEPETPTETEIPTEPALSCEGVLLSEAMPNAAGSDTGREFIELFNPTNEVISLSGCRLQLSGSSKQFTFTDQVLEPGAYLAVLDAVTGLTLPNAGGGTIWLISAANVELDTLAYPGAMVDDTAWALADGVWQMTYAPTASAPNIAMPLKPCAENQVRDEVTLQCRAVVVATANTLTPCKEGQERNPLTNRCRAVAAASTLTPCKEGQERNPETNRCRSVLAATSTLKPCAADEERNPETNRCRKVAAAATLTPCKDGYERNPDTNRCRKIVTSSADIAEVTDVESSTEASKTSWYITGAIILAALTYAIYEWRQDIIQRFRNLKRG